MTGKEARYIYDCVEKEGFDYCFVGYSTFDDVKDPEFHRLRTDYLAARDALAEYIGTDE